MKKTSKLLICSIWILITLCDCMSVMSYSPLLDYNSSISQDVTTMYTQMLSRAESIVNFEWVPSQRIYTWNENPYNDKMYFEEGELVKGVPYTLFSWELGFDSLLSSKQFASKANINYSTEKYCSSVSANRIGPAYGNCCATLVSEVFGGNFMNGDNPKYDGVGRIQSSSYSLTYEKVKVQNIHPGDSLSNTSGGHIVWVGNVTDDIITIYESTPPISQKVELNKKEHTNELGYLIYGGKEYSTVTKSSEFIWDGLDEYSLDKRIPLPFKGFPNSNRMIDVYDTIDGRIKDCKLSKENYCFVDAVYLNGWCHVSFLSETNNLETGYINLSPFYDNSFSLYRLTTQATTPFYEKYNNDIVLFNIPQNTTLLVLDETDDYYMVVYSSTKENLFGWIKKESYSVTYNAEGCSNVPDFQIKKKDEEIKISEILPAKQISVSFDANGGILSEDSSFNFQLDFVSWNTDRNGTGLNYYPGDSYNSNENLILYAIWNTERDIGKLPIPTKKGYDFIGWFTEAENGVRINDYDVFLNSTVCYAHWVYNPSEYVIHYDANSGTNAPDDQIKEKGKGIVLSNDIPSRFDYNFYGWTTEKDSVTVVYEPGDIYTQDRDITLYAVWEKITDSKLLIGDVNSDGSVNNLDRFILTRYLAKWDDYSENSINFIASDVNCDGNVNNLDRLILTRYLANWEGYCLGEKIEEEKVEVNSFVYGKSELGRDLTCYEISEKEYNRTILLNFAIHGFEDGYDADAQNLVDTADLLIEHYRNAESLNNCRLLIVPCANPDGLYDGNTNNGFGRCNANGVDLNRDFDANYTSNYSARNYTPYAFSAAESRALRDLCNENNPDVVIDFHGWLNTTIGDSELADIFYEELELNHQNGFTSTNCKGYFVNWAHQNGALSLLVEFKNTDIPIDSVICAIDKIINSQYDNGEGEYKTNETYSQFAPLQGYTISTGRITTYRGFNKPFDSLSYIDGSTDLCTIERIYENGWVKVTYPISSGNKTAYCKIDDFISEENIVSPYPAKVSNNTEVFRRSDLSEKIGSVWSTDTFYVVAEMNEKLQIVYPLDSGGWKLGWITTFSLSHPVDYG